MNKPELLSPAGDPEKLKVAFHFGADAVYVGLKKFSLRAKTKNFDNDAIKEAITYTHSIGKKIYIALNIYYTPDQTEELEKYLIMLEELGPDGLIVSDLGAFRMARQFAPSIPIHISTQANITNQEAALLLEELGAKRIILARELTLDQIKIIDDKTNIELEAFIHGAMCIAYSGRCLLSSYMTHPALGKRKDIEKDDIRSANKGACSHSCRWEFVLKERSRGEQNYDITEDDEGTYILSSKDMCMIDHIEDLIRAGISSLKIEGRMKSILYISSIIRAYRQAIDHIFDPEIPYIKEDIDNELNIVSHREFSTGFFYDSPQEEAQTTRGGVYKREIRLAAMVNEIKGDRALLKVYNTMKTDGIFEYIAPGMRTVKLGSIRFFDEHGEEKDVANHTDYAEALLFDENGNKLDVSQFDIIRMEYAF